MMDDWPIGDRANLLLGSTYFLIDHLQVIDFAIRVNAVPLTSCTAVFSAAASGSFGSDFRDLS